METVHEGWLKKTPSEKKIFRTKATIQKTNLRWFVLKQSGDIPDQYILDYYTDSSCKKQKGHIDLDQCKKIDKKIDLKKPDEFSFSIETTKKTFNLLAKSKDELNKWIECLCIVCGFKSNYEESSSFLKNHLSFPSRNNSSKSQNVFIISYANPSLVLENSCFDNLSLLKKLSNSHSANKINLQNENKNKNIDNAKNKWINFSGSLSIRNSSLNKGSNLFNCSTLHSKKMSAYIPISECYTGKSIFNKNENQLIDLKEKNENQLIDLDEKTDFFEFNKENKSNNKTCILDLSLNESNLKDLIELSNNSNDLPNIFNYDVPNQLKINKEVKDLLNVVPSPPKETLYANSQLTNNCNNQNLVNYINFDTKYENDFKNNSSSKIYYNNFIGMINTNSPPPRPPKPNSIKNKKSSSLNSLNNLTQNELDVIPKPKNESFLDTMYSIPKSKVELELEKELVLRNSFKEKNCNNLDTIVPLTRKNSSENFNRYTNAPTDVFKKNDNQSIYDYDKPSLPVNNNLDNFKVPAKFNDKLVEPTTPSLIVTSTPLHNDKTDWHFVFSEQNEKNLLDLGNSPPLVHRNLKPKRSDTSLESIILLNKSPNILNDLSNTSLNNSKVKKVNSLNINPPRIPYKGRQILKTNSLASENDLIYLDNLITKSHKKSLGKCNEIQYLDLDLDWDNMSINSNLNDNSSNFKDNSIIFKDTDLNNSFINFSSFDNSQTIHLNNSTITQNGLNYSKFIFTNNKSTDQTQNTLNNSIDNNINTVYRTVDFIKTKAFNELKDGLNRKTQD